MKNREFDKLIVKFINNTISEADSQKLLTWLEIDENVVYFNEFVQINQLINAKKKYDYKAPLKQFLAKLNNKKRLRKKVYLIAASVVVIICLGVFTTINIQNNISDRNWTNVVAKSNIKNAVKLITAKGEVVFLSKSGSRVLHIDGDELQESKDSIVYSKDSKNTGTNYNELIVPIGQIYTITLADGSVATVNSDSKIRFTTAFTGQTRDVWVQGEVFFKVAHDKSKPFIVHTDKFDTKVLGTEFNLRAYHDESEELVTLVNGSVQLVKDKNTKILIPGSQFIYPNKFGFNESEIKKVDTYMYTSWVNGIMYFDNQRLEDLMIRLSKWYSFEYEFKNKKLKERRYTGGIKKNDDLRKVFKMLNNVNDANFSVKNDIITIE